MCAVYGCRFQVALPGNGSDRADGYFVFHAPGCCALVLLVSGYQFKMVGLLLVVEPDERQQEEPIVIQNGPVGWRFRRAPSAHTCRLERTPSPRIPGSPQRRTEIRLVKHRRQCNGRQHGAVIFRIASVSGDTFSTMTVSSASAEPIAAQSATSGATKEQSREETDSRHPQIDQKDLSVPFSR